MSDIVSSTKTRGILRKHVTPSSTPCVPGSPAGLGSLCDSSVWPEAVAWTPPVSVPEHSSVEVRKGTIGSFPLVWERGLYVEPQQGVLAVMITSLSSSRTWSSPERSPSRRFSSKVTFSCKWLMSWFLSSSTTIACWDSQQTLYCSAGGCWGEATSCILFPWMG